jgi:hypothetical protein
MLWPCTPMPLAYGTFFPSSVFAFHATSQLEAHLQVLLHTCWMLPVPRKGQTHRKAGAQSLRASQAWEAAGLPKGGL